MVRTSDWEIISVPQAPLLKFPEEPVGRSVQGQREPPQFVQLASPLSKVLDEERDRSPVEAKGLRQVAERERLLGHYVFDELLHRLLFDASHQTAPPYRKGNIAGGPALVKKKIGDFSELSWEQKRPAPVLEDSRDRPLGGLADRHQFQVRPVV